MPFPDTFPVNFIRSTISSVHMPKISCPIRGKEHIPKIKSPHTDYNIMLSGKLFQLKNIFDL